MGLRLKQSDLCYDGRMKVSTTSYGLILGLFLSVLIILSNVTFPQDGPDSSPLMLIATLGIGLYVAWSAYDATAGENDDNQVLKVGAITSLLGFSISMLSFVVIDNLFSRTVSKQADKIYGFLHSSYPSMQAYINAGLVRGILVGIPASIAFGLACGWVARMIRLHLKHSK